MSGRFRFAINKKRLDQTRRVIKGEKYRSFIKTRLNSTSNKRIDECVRKDARRQYRIKNGLFSQHGRVTAKWKRFICFENKKNRCLLFSVNLYSCVPTEECAKKRTWYQRILCFIVIFFFNIKHKIGTLLLLSGLFSLVTQVFQSILHFICDLFI